MKIYGQFHCARCGRPLPYVDVTDKAAWELAQASGTAEVICFRCGGKEIPEPPQPPEQIHITCPECGAAMKIRVNRENGSEFCGCTRYPECRGTRPLPHDLVMKRAGATMLPGLEE